jgi:hypothetical protein
MMIISSVKAITERTQLQTLPFIRCLGLDYVCRPPRVSSFGARWVVGFWVWMGGWTFYMLRRGCLLCGERAYVDLCVLGGIVTISAGHQSDWRFVSESYGSGAAAVVPVHA